MTNIDHIALSKAQSLIEDVSNYGEVENAATKILGVLTEDGVYAAFLYVFAKVKDNIHQEFVKNLLQLLYEIFDQDKFKDLSEQYVQIIKELQVHRDKRDKEKLKKLKDEMQKIMNSILPEVAQITEDLDRTLLTRFVLERFLIYVRYHAKAQQG